MNHYETGKRTPSADTLLRLAEVLECDAGWLLTGRSADGSSPPPAPSPSSPVSPNDDFVYVPEYDIGGEGREGSIQSSQIVDHLAFKRHWVEQELRTRPEHLVLIHCTGDAMEPTLRTGDLLLVDRSPEKKRGDGVYLLNIEGGLYVRRLEQRVDGSLIVRGDNPAAAPETRLERDSLKDLNLVGRVVWVGRRI